MLFLLPILRVPLLQPLTGLTGLFMESAVSTWALALATTSHSAVRACCSELATCCEQEKPSLCSSRSKSKIGLEKSVRWAGKEASCRGPWGSQKQHQRLSPPSSIGSGGASSLGGSSKDSSGQVIVPFLLRNSARSAPNPGESHSK